MKGSILDFSVQKSEGLISGDDNKRYSFAASEWRAVEPPTHGMRVDFDVKETTATGIFREITKDAAASATNLAEPSNLLGLTAYYQEEFKKIHASNESYKGKWNWTAFFFGALWAITKGAWLSVLVCVIVALVTGGIGGVVYWFIYGARGNYIYYSLHIKKKQLAA